MGQGWGVWFGVERTMGNRPLSGEKLHRENGPAEPGGSRPRKALFRCLHEQRTIVAPRAGIVKGNMRQDRQESPNSSADKRRLTAHSRNRTGFACRALPVSGQSGKKRGEPACRKPPARDEEKAKVSRASRESRLVARTTIVYALDGGYYFVLSSET
jgi:hypothetical protein